jgi:hypothetical protein
MRHATQEDLDQLEALLAELRELPQLRERRRGYFSRGGQAFLHFHEDAGDYYVDVKLDGKFERVKVTSRTDQARFLTLVKDSLSTLAIAVRLTNRHFPGMGGLLDGQILVDAGTQ